MSLKEKLQEDLKSSMKNKDAIKKSVVTLIRAAIKQHQSSLSKERIHLRNSSRLTGMIWLKKQNLKYKC